MIQIYNYSLLTILFFMIGINNTVAEENSLNKFGAESQTTKNRKPIGQKLQEEY